jgi:hypothetical protein
LHRGNTPLLALRCPLVVQRLIAVGTQIVRRTNL